ncbi:MAG: two-component system, OmpR family, lantibiotic biosynthesis response regulator NisR/SpaR [Thermoanaerobacterium sp.]|jgi:two-component system, OmpR family, lantibiotic biosynthesis response regulator NisR/SpaR|uniref:Stage 0 sporulation protein A homolog n=1 Tax=Thermoanaerobacterium thermosaccharolyticum (strain ATCC 7956 / DSM 571 / NCIMB 9385 / NCA 3814 / NCTC 13789 / WDCM 00135 / 2032) TaxID=580327 RepID=D9TSQ1_THETC|nr:response regulator transcription factor [Thermoanaerobacterium thermosaccharolyticum]ADL69372.1 two component transcriptional regulator, winged helix family [Thermoanaerobacterium thermosaccharolyticum DSM 571]MCP2238996.1 DNA-binding response OmpR family regulator [Thermoanaerobacterium thermosaccharolyticum]MDN5316432.1 two-component system, OmpR family, lantibiotic biosynthesis response regulator NisR/SpaR [Thermoanaerobacterium sp.]
MSKILIIDDEKEIADLLKDSLERKGNTVLTAYNGKEGIEKAKEMPDLIVLDIMMPDIDGYEVCRKIRDTVICPIVFLSAKQSEMDRIKGFALGGDDYVVKPFSLKELLARIDAHLRREKRAILLNEEGKRALLNFKNITIDLKSREVMVKGNPIGLTKKEFDVLELLSLHPGQVFSKEQIYEKVWGFDAEGDTTTVTEHIKNIRAKIENLDPDTEYIKTVWGIGYKWEKVL